MSGAKLQSVEMLHLLWLLPALGAFFAYAAWKRRSALARFVEAPLLAQLRVTTSPVRRRWKAGILLSGCAFLVIALARPAWNPKPKTLTRRGRDVVFMLDVSRSMLAEDLAPNRLERSKLAIRDAVEVLEGDRVALVVFAGTAVVKCPLTLDYGFFRMMLEDVSMDSAARGGTMIGDALRKTLKEVFDDREKRFKDIVLITDGEDHDSFPVEAAKEAGVQGVRLIAIGIGDAPGGRYLNVATGTIDLGQVYTKLVAAAEKKELEAKTVKRHEEKFQVFLAVALALLLVETLISERSRREAT